MLDNHPRANKIKHIETGLIFNSKSQCATYFCLTKDILETKIKHGEFEIILKDKQRLTATAFISWLRAYLNQEEHLIVTHHIKDVLNNIKK